MRRILLYFSLVFLGGCLCAETLQDKIKTLMPKNVYQANERFIQKIFQDEKVFYRGKDFDIVKIIATLKNNGLLALKLPKPSNVSITLRINATNALTDVQPSLTFLTYAASNILSTIGYSYFYITGAQKKQDQIVLTYTLNSESNIDPMVMIDNLLKRGYHVINIHRDSALHWIYDISLMQSIITHAKTPTKGQNSFIQINGKYWFTFNSAGTLQIMPQDSSVQWYPKIFIFDNNMNLIDSFIFTSPKNTYKFHITSEMRHIFVSDNFNADILRNGITLDFKPN